MKYYQIGIKNTGTKYIALTIIDESSALDIKLLGLEHWDIAFYTGKFFPKEQIKIKANEYKITDIEEDFEFTGSPGIVSEDYKKLVEDLDPEAAQFFETENITCKTKKKYYVMHIIKTVECLDKNRSRVNTWGGITGLVDISKVGEKDHIFRMSEDKQCYLVSEKFYKEFKKRKLTGCAFDLWSSAHLPKKQ